VLLSAWMFLIWTAAYALAAIMSIWAATVVIAVDKWSLVAWRQMNWPTNGGSGDVRPALARSHGVERVIDPSPRIRGRRDREHPHDVWPVGIQPCGLARIQRQVQPVHGYALILLARGPPG
jgi:hypothetical protein